MLNIKDKMMGAICGDICGSVYEWNNIKYKLSENELINPNCSITDDSVMTIAVAEGIRNAFDKISDNWYGNTEFEEVIGSEIIAAMKSYGRKYPYAGYGSHFYRWIFSEDAAPYNSCGNGSAMRASYCGWAANSLKEAERLAEISARVTHNHPDGINGAKVVAASIYLLRSGGTKDDVREYVRKIYDIDFRLDDIRADYKWGALCKNTVPQAVVSFLEGDSFADVISNALSIGGDSDTLAAIAGSIAEACYPIPEDLKNACFEKLDDFLRECVEQFSSKLRSKGKKQEGEEMIKKIGKNARLVLDIIGKATGSAEE